MLKHYKVEADGKVKRTRKECPSEQCGAGIFMATMADRHYCGKCHLTYMIQAPAAKGKGGGKDAAKKADAAPAGDAPAKGGKGKGKK